MEVLCYSSDDKMRTRFEEVTGSSPYFVAKNFFREKYVLLYKIAWHYCIDFINNFNVSVGPHLTEIEASVKLKVLYFIACLI